MLLPALQGFLLGNWPRPCTQASKGVVISVAAVSCHAVLFAGRQVVLFSPARRLSRCAVCSTGQNPCQGIATGVWASDWRHRHRGSVSKPQLSCKVFWSGDLQILKQGSHW